MNIVKILSSSRKMLGVLCCVLSGVSVSQAQGVRGRPASKAPSNVQLLDQLLAKGGNSKLVRLDDMLLPRSEIEAYRDKLKSHGSGPILNSGFVVDVDYWTGGKVAYVFDEDFPADGRAIFEGACREWEQWANLKFSPRTNEENYIYIYRDETDSSFSQVGMVGGQQIMSLASWANKMTACHEMAHALGVMHEQSRSDRDQFVSINFDNVIPGMEGNFAIVPDSRNIGTYDFGSVMHYPAVSFPIDPNVPTIVCKPGYEQFQDEMGQRDHLSDLDKAGMAEIYGSKVVVKHSFSVTDAQVIEGDNATSPAKAVFTVTLDSPNSEPATVTYTANSGVKDKAGKGGATVGEDLLATTNVLTFKRGETKKTVTVLIKGDTVIEGNETFTLDLTGASTGITFAKKRGVGTIIDDDAVPALSVAATSVTEGNKAGTNARFTVSLSSPTSKSVTVSYSTSNGTASAASDYTAITKKTLTFSARETTKVVSVPIVGDLIDEDNETFRLTLSAPTNATLAAGAVQAEATIIDDDAAPSITATGGSVLESAGAEGSLIFTVNLSHPSSRSVKVSYIGSQAANSPATAGVDFKTFTEATVNFAPGQTSKTIKVVVKDDAIDEDDESVALSLSNPINAKLAKSVVKVIGTIRDDDDAPSLSISDASVTEGSGPVIEASFTVKLSAPSSRTVKVFYATADGSATSGLDYKVIRSTSMTFAPGETSKKVGVQVKGDTATEADETFSVNLSQPTNATLGKAVGTGTIVNDDISSPVISVNSPSMTEGDTGTKTLTFTVRLSKSSASNITVNFATQNGTASAGEDYLALAPGTLTFAPGTTSKTISVKVIGDIDEENDETFNLVLSEPNGATVAQDGGEATIFDNDFEDELDSTPPSTPKTSAASS